MTIRRSGPKEVARGKVPVVVSVKPADELPKLSDPDGAADRYEASMAKVRKFGGAQENAGRKPKMLSMGLVKDADPGDPRYKNALRSARQYLKKRKQDYQIAFGFVSSGVMGILASASMALCASRYLYEKAYIASEPENFELMKQGAKHADSAMRMELAAWEMASRESVLANKRMVNQGVPIWMQNEADQMAKGKPASKKVTHVKIVEAEVLAENPFVVTDKDTGSQ